MSFELVELSKIADTELDNLPDKAGGDDLTHQGTDGMEDSSLCYSNMLSIR